MGILIKDIAEIVGVSNATVSNALNNRKGVSESKRKEILSVASELGYFKNLQVDEQRIEFLIIANRKNVVNDSAFFSELIKGVESECYSHSTDLNIRHIDLKDLEKILSINNLSEKTKGYIILATEIDSNDISFLEDFKFPLVILDASFKNPNFTYVSINNRDGAYNATKYFIDQGFLNIGLINSVDKIENFLERQIGFDDAIRDHLANKQNYEVCKIEVTPTLEGSYLDMKNLLENGHKPPHGYFVVNDTIAFGVRKALDEFGFDNISLIGFDDIPLASIMSPPLTTVKVDKATLGRIAVRQIIDQLEGQYSSRLKIEINTSLVVRQSVLNEI